MDSEEPAFFPIPKLAEARVSIVGLGLMGASLALDLRGHCAEIIGTSRSPETLDYARKHAIVDRVVDFEEALHADLAILAAPVRTIMRQLRAICESAGVEPATRTVLIDLGSTKADLVAVMQHLPPRFDPVGGHPMCGKEVSGIRYAEAGLYGDKTFILTPLERTSTEAMVLVQEMVARIGSHPLVLTPERQDALVAMISHIPYLAAVSLVRATQARNDPMLWEVAASGFRDTTRVAAGDVTMFLDILLTNRTAILDTLATFQGELDHLYRLIDAGDEAALRTALEAPQRRRAQMFKSPSPEPPPV
ncbi:MAG: prephenate dehydrogenase [Chloroflexota bacterium]